LPAAFDALWDEVPTSALVQPNSTQAVSAADAVTPVYFLIFFLHAAQIMVSCSFFFRSFFQNQSAARAATLFCLYFCLYREADHFKDPAVQAGILPLPLTVVLSQLLISGL
jgi:hypothetical protein